MDYVVFVASAIIGGKFRKNDVGDDVVFLFLMFVCVVFVVVGVVVVMVVWCLMCVVKLFFIFFLRKFVRSKEFWTKGLRVVIDFL